MIANAFAIGSTITDPPLTFVLEDATGKPISEVYGDFREGDFEAKYDWLVHQTFGVTLAGRDEFYAKNDPILKVTAVGSGVVGRYSKRRGIIDGVKEFKVCSVSTNTNSFGLHGLVLVARDGEAYEVGSNVLNIKEKGTVVRATVRGGAVSFAKLGWEIPKQLDTAPPPVVAEVWA
jgi:hypothetical protein